MLIVLIKKTVLSGLLANKLKQKIGKSLIITIKHQIFEVLDENCFVECLCISGTEVPTLSFSLIQNSKTKYKINKHSIQLKLQIP
jgi:hypothetical protein